MQAKRRHQTGHNICAVLLVEELDHYLDVRSHEHILILLPQELFQKEKSFLIINDPICPNTLYIGRKSQTTWIIWRFSHVKFKIFIIDI